MSAVDFLFKDRTNNFLKELEKLINSEQITIESVQQPFYTIDADVRILFQHISRNVTDARNKVTSTHLTIIFLRYSSTDSIYFIIAGRFLLSIKVEITLALKIKNVIVIKNKQVIKLTILATNLDLIILFDKISGAGACLLYTSPSPRDKRQSRMPSSA